MKIDAQKVQAVLLDCLFTPEEPKDNAVRVEGITANFGFHPERLESHRDEVRQWLLSLPHEFHKGSGGGWAFLQACVDEDGQQWGEHADIQNLLVLGMGLGFVKCQLSREMWSSLPGGMPYYVVDLTPIVKEQETTNI